jgi:TonB-dependent starch-binding outer membrane protein SusC
MMKKLYKKLSLTAVILLVLTSVGLAQERVVSGMVTDENGSSMPGVNVLVKGTSTGTATDSDGNFKISVGGGDQSTLVFTFVGYATAEIIVGARSVVNIQLTPDVQTLTELVVTGYSSQRKADITGAVAVVDAESLKAVKGANIGQQLAGRAPGVTISTNGGPGAESNIRIRGISSLTGSSDPLFIIDGVQIQGDKSLNGLNPNDIESMQVLKDAASSAIYGARANAGVIIITTKQGKAGKIKVNYNGYYGSQNPVGGYNDILSQDPLEYAQKYHTIKNPGSGAFYGGVGSAATIPTLFYHPTGNTDESTYNYPDDPRIEPTLFMRSNAAGTDWWDETFDPAPIQNHNVSLSGGSDKGTVAASVDYFKQDGTMKYTNFERLSARINGQLKADKFTFTQSMAFTYTKGVSQAGGEQNEQNVMTQILKMNSIVPLYDISGVNYGGAKPVNFSNGTNPLARTWRNKDNFNKGYRLLGGVSGEYKITSYLSVKSSFSGDFSQLNQENFSYPTWENREFNGSNNFSETHNTWANWVWTNQLNFSKTIGDKHKIDAFVGYEAVRNSNRRISGRVDNFGFTANDIRYLEASLASINTVNSGASYGTLASMFAKVDYSLSDKYIISATVRRDGSSAFAPDTRYGVFPAFSAGWRISEESFLQSTSWLDDLKLRAGWGITGNQSGIPSGNAYNRYGARSIYDAGYDIAGDNTSNAAGYALTDYGNLSTKWEENKMLNLGVDATILNGKFAFVFDWYKKDITDLLFRAAYPGVAGAAQAPARNVANMTNVGWDGSINYRENFGDLGLTVGVNLSHFKNEITQLVGDTKLIFPGGPDKRFGEIGAWQVGSPIGSFYGYVNDGLFQNQADLDAIEQSGEGLGRLRWKDISGPDGTPDGRITDADKGIIGSPQPKLTMGLNIGLTYKALDFNMQLFGSFGNDIYNYNKLFTHFGFFNSNIAQEVIDNSWTSEGNGTLPIIDPNDSQSVTSSSFYVEDGSYVRAQNITLGYTIPKMPVIQKLRVYVQMQNAFTITGYSGIDPALSSVQQGDAFTGYDFGNYPSSRTFMVGVNASF